jgi:CDGSH-type Zn-finger protein
MIKIRAKKRGPLVIDLGEADALELVGTDGQPLDLGDRKRVTLCRCGGSATPPFCDGTHNRLPFEAPPPVSSPSGERTETTGEGSGGEG